MEIRSRTPLVVVLKPRRWRREHVTFESGPPNVYPWLGCTLYIVSSDYHILIDLLENDLISWHTALPNTTTYNNNNNNKYNNAFDTFWLTSYALTFKIIVMAFRVKCGASMVNTWSTTCLNRLEGLVNRLSKTSVNTSTQWGSSEIRQGTTPLSLSVWNLQNLQFMTEKVVE